MPSKFRENRQNNRGGRILAVDIVGHNMAYDLQCYGTATWAGSNRAIMEQNFSKDSACAFYW